MLRWMTNLQTNIAKVKNMSDKVLKTKFSGDKYVNIPFKQSKAKQNQFHILINGLFGPKYLIVKAAL